MLFVAPSSPCSLLLYPSVYSPGRLTMGNSHDKPSGRAGRKAFTSQEIEYLQQTYYDVAMRYVPSHQPSRLLIS